MNGRLLDRLGIARLGRLTVLFACFALIISCGAPSVSGAANPTSTTTGPTGTLTIGTNADIESTHPYLSHQIVGISARMNMFDDLVEYDYSGKLVPGLATSWKVDGLTLTFTLRHGVKFHNGDEMTADDVKFSFDHLVSKELNSSNAGNFSSVSGFKVIDPYTVQMTMSKIDARIFDALANNFAILPQKYIQSVGLQGFIAHPVGTGPFKFVEWVKDDHLTMQANESYWDGSYKGKPAVKTLIFRPITNAATRVQELRSGGVDMIEDVPPDQVAPLKSGGFDVVQSSSPALEWIFFNTTNPAGAVLKDKRVRLAMNYAVDVNTIIKTVLQGYATPLSGGVHEAVMGYNSSVAPIPFDQAKAKALMADAGKSAGFSLDMDITDATKPDVAEAVVAQLAQIGVKVNINVVPTSVYNTRWVQHQLSPLYLNVWYTFTDPALLDILAGCSGRLSSFCSPDAQKFLDQGGGTLDLAAREAAYKQATAAFAGDPFGIFLNSFSNLTGVSKKVQGWKPHAVAYIIGTNARVK